MWQLDCPLHTRRARTLCVCNKHISGLNYLSKCCELENEISYSSTDRKIRQQLLQWTGCPYGCRYQSIPQYVMDLGAVAWGGGADAGTVVLTHIQSFLKQQCSEHTIKQL